MRLSVENIFLVLVLVSTEAWFLSGYHSGNPDFEPAIAFLVAFGALFTKDRIKESLGFSEQFSTHDASLFEEFQRELPVEPTIRLLKETDFGSSFPKTSIQPLYNFADTWNSVEKEFLNKNLEKARKDIYEAAKDLAMKFAQETVPVGTGDFISVYPDSLRAQGGPRPQHVIESAMMLNEESSDFVPKYESFVRTCKTALKL